MNMRGGLTHITTEAYQFLLQLKHAQKVCTFKVL